MSQAVKALNGLVTFHVTYSTPLTNLTALSFIDAVPESSAWVDPRHISIKNALYTVAQRLPLTTNIEFHGETLPPEIEGLREFWSFAQANKDDYRALWEKYASCVSMTVGNAWWGAVYEDKRLTAPKELRVTDKDAAKDPN